jgi:arylsulfatase A-like enzyme
MTRFLLSYQAALLLAPLSVLHSAEATRPNVVLLFADDISARELPIYGSTVWSPPTGGDSKDPAYRAKTPVLDRLAKEGCWIANAWAATVCSPSRAMMMTGRYASLHKWWFNGDYGQVDLPGGQSIWPLYASSPLQMGEVARRGGYASLWAGKTQMHDGDVGLFGFSEGVFTPGDKEEADNPYSDFKLSKTKGAGKNKHRLINADTGEEVASYAQQGWYWKPHVMLMKQQQASPDLHWWPNTPESKAAYGLNTYGPDVELDFIFEFMQRQQATHRPFFIYHTSHLGHDAFDWLHPDEKNKWPGTPLIHWDGTRYHRTEPNITGDRGVYDTHGTVTAPGIHHHINYLDYQVWRYLEKFKELGIEKDTIFIFSADNGTSGYGKGSPVRQRGCHVPLIFYAPSKLTKQGKQDILANIADIVPTMAEVMGVSFPQDYPMDGKSLWPYLSTAAHQHRDWIYSWQSEMQLIRGNKVMRDGRGNWWDVERPAADLDSFASIKDWSQVSAAHRAERERLEVILPRFDRYGTEHDAPGAMSTNKKPKKSRNRSKTGAPEV